MIDQTTPKGRIVSAAMQLAVERPWDQVAMLDIAGSAGISLMDLRREFGSKTMIVASFIRSIDDVVLAKAAKPQPGTPPRDAIFEVIMARFDAMQPYKTGLKSIMQATGFDMDLAKRLFSSQAWMLNAAGVPLDGLGGSVRVLGLTSVFASVFRTWLDDDDAGLARTMAALDRRLRRGEETLQTFDGMCGSVKRMFDTFGQSARRAAPERPEPANEGRI